jgi:hypothetical protein
MGSASIKERKRFYSDGKLESIYFIKNGRFYGTYKSFYHNGIVNIIRCYDEHGEISHETEYYNNKQLARETYYKNGLRHGDNKWYNMDGRLESHTIYHYDYFVLYAIYNNNILDYYITNKCTIYKGTSPSGYMHINLAIVNPIRTLQRRFRRKYYGPILNYLNDVIGVIDMSYIILSYVGCYKKLKK